MLRMTTMKKGRTNDLPIIINYSEGNYQPYFTIFHTNTERDITEAEPVFWEIFKRAVDAGQSPPNEYEPPTLKRMRQSRLDCRAAVLAVLSVVARRRRLDLPPGCRAGQVIARMVWAQRWEFYDDGGVPNGD